MRKVYAGYHETVANLKGLFVRVFCAGLAAVLFLFYSASAMGLETDSGEEREERKEITGEAVRITAGMISVEFAKTRTSVKEILIPIDEDTRFRRLRDVSDIQAGDKVKVAYKETYLEDPGTGRRTEFKRVATEISLVRRATDGLMSVSR